MYDEMYEFMICAALARSLRTMRAHRSVAAREACPAKSRTVVEGMPALIHSTIAVALKSWRRVLPPARRFTEGAVCNAH